ncbi:class I SAM-dependent methyltransferase [Robbsia sp. KACC 23696]|uniref:class I SAM-dependent methyltransferase n=1 Tax=Robbsia sp. KACC 23696 TaxID=3149231 RepID=UPI00325A5F39
MMVWEENGVTHQALWRSEAGVPVPKRVIVADDTMPADQAYRLACEGAALLWRGDFQNARQLLQALGRRIEKKTGRKPSAAEKAPDRHLADAFNRHRLAQSQRARTLGALLLPLGSDYRLPLRRAPDVRGACEWVYGPAAVASPAVEAQANSAADVAADSDAVAFDTDSADAPRAAASHLAAPVNDGSVVSMRELLGVIGAYEWRKKGVEVPQTGGRIHPHYGVFSPVRGEYVDLVAQAPLPAALRDTPVAFDIGVGTGVLSIVLARRGVARIVSTDSDPRALACAAENVARHALETQIDLVRHDLFPPEAAGRAALIVCNPPWLPARPSSPIEAAVYDPGSRMLLGFLDGLAARLAPGGEGWLIMSDFAEHLGLRTPTQLADAIAAAGLKVVGKVTAKPLHPRASDRDDPLHAARAAETTTLWRLTGV